MILDLIVILLVVILSCLFCMNDSDKNNKNSKTNKQTCSLSHIVIGLTVIVFYKLVRYYRVYQNKNTQNTQNTQNNANKEHFTIDKSLNDFITGATNDIINQDRQALSDNKLADYTQKISDLTVQLTKLNNNASQDQPIQIQTSSNIDTISLENQQSLQQFQIDYLSKQIKNTQDIINATTISSTSQNYKPIKIYSSCVANADGTMSTDQPVKDDFNSLQPLQSVLNTNETSQILNTSSQGKSNNLDLSSMLNKLLNTK